MQRNTTRLAAIVALCTALAGPAISQSALEKIAIQILAAKFGINTTEVARVQAASGLSLFEVAPIFSASSAAHTKADTVWQLRRQGLGWGQVAHRIGMQPGRFNKLRKAGAFDSGRIWSSSIGSRFAVPVSQVVTVQRKGASPQDIIGAILVAKASHRSPQAVFDEYRRANDWEPVRTKYKVDFEHWQSYARNPPHHTRAVIVFHPGKARGHSFTPPGKAKGHGQGDGQGNGKGHGKGHGNGQGHGKGNGKGGGG